MVCGMNDEDIVEMLGYKYWPVVDIEHNKFVAKLYRLNKKQKTWKQVKTRTFNDPHKAWDYLKETLMNILKFVL